MKNTKKYITFSILIKKEVKRIDKNKEKLQKPYLTNLLIAQELCHDLVDSLAKRIYKVKFTCSHIFYFYLRFYLKKPAASNIS